MCIIVKTKGFYDFTINSQSKLKTFSTLFLRHLLRKEKLAKNFNKVSWWALSLLDLRNFHSSFYVKNYYLIFFFKYCRVLSLKTKKNLLQKDTSHLKIIWYRGVMYRVWDWRLCPKFWVQLAAESNLYLQLVAEKIHTFVVFLRYLWPHGWSDTNFTAVAICSNQVKC